MSRVIVLTGKKGAGKDTLASQVFDMGFARVSFSDQLKMICASLFPWMKNDYPPSEKDTKLFGDLSPRDIWLKMSVLTEIDRDILVRATRKQMDSIPQDKNIIITDLRKPEEYEFVREMGYPIIRIRDDNPNRREDAVEQWVDQFEVYRDFFNNKDEDSKVRFKKLIEEIISHD